MLICPSVAQNQHGNNDSTSIGEPISVDVIGNECVVEDATPSSESEMNKDVVNVTDCQPSGVAVMCSTTETDNNPSPEDDIVNNQHFEVDDDKNSRVDCCIVEGKVHSYITC